MNKTSITTTQYEIAACVDIGLHRGNNEDNIYVDNQWLAPADVDKPFRHSYTNVTAADILAICDGMGGEADGEFASFTAVSELDKFVPQMLNSSPDDFKQALNEYITHINKIVCERMTETHQRIGSTLAMLAIRKEGIYSVNIGDSKVYRFRNGLEQLSVDHNLASRMQEVGGMAKKNVLTQFIGIFEDEFTISPHITDKLPIRNNDIFLICSDGLTDNVSESRISKIMKTYKSSAEITDNLLREALANGGTDNISIITVKVKSPLLSKLTSIFKR